MRYKKIIIINHEPLTDQIRLNFYIDVFLSNGIDVEYWDISPLLYKNFNLPGEIYPRYSKKIFSISELDSCVETSRNALFIVEIYNEQRAAGVINILIKFKVFCGRIDSYSGCDPILSVFENVLFRVKSLYHRKNRISYLLSFILTKFSRDKFPKLPINFFFNSMFNKSYGEIDLKINSINHQKFLSAKSNTVSLINGKYAVFLDEYLPFHPDFKFLNGQDNINATSYFKVMNNFFDMVEVALNLKVVIAAHPKSEYRLGAFNNREILKFETENLVRDSQLVLVHSSLSVDFAILNYKPVIFTYTNELKELIYSNYFFIKYRSKLLKLKAMNLDEILQEDIILPIVNVDAYNNYKYTYLTSPEIEQKTNNDIIVSHIKSLL